MPQRRKLLQLDSKKNDGLKSVIVIIPAVVISIIYVVISSFYTNAFHYTATNGQNLSLAVPRDHAISLKIDPGVESVKGYWGSISGFSLKLKGIHDIQLIPPKTNEWNTEIFTSKADGSTNITLYALYAFPSSTSVQENRTLDGAIVGDLVYPLANNDGTFTNKLKNIRIPVHVEIYPLDSGPWAGYRHMLYITAFVMLITYTFMYWVLRLYEKLTTYDGKYFNISLDNHSYYRHVRLSVILIVIFYGGPFLLALALVNGNSLLEIYGLAGGMVLVPIVSAVVTAVLRKTGAIA